MVFNFQKTFKMIAKIFKFEKVQEHKEEIKPMKVRSYYPKDYPINGSDSEKFAYYAKNTELIPLTK